MWQIVKELVLCLAIGCFTLVDVSAQINVIGKVVDRKSNAPLSNVELRISNGNIHYSNELGEFSFPLNGEIPYIISTNILGYKDAIFRMDSLQDLKAIYLELDPDPLLLESIVISDYHTDRKGLFTPNSLSTIFQPLEKSYRGTADILSNIPGVFSDASLGEVYSRVYARGISASAEDDIGWYYMSLLEDGLPITAVQYNYMTPDFFYRTDLSTSKLEAIKGGKAGILFQNAPGGIFNFLSSPITNTLHGRIKTTFGLLGKANPYYRSDAFISSPINHSSWAIAASGFYRYDKGPREIDYSWNKGGQLKFSLQKLIPKGILKFSGKYLNDHVNRYTGLAATNWSQPQAAFNQNFNYTALMLPSVQSMLWGGKNFSTENLTNFSYDAENGIHVEEKAFMAFLDMQIREWELKFSAKYSNKSADWQTSFGNQPMGLESFLPYFLSGDDAPWGILEFRDAKTKESLAIVNNVGALNVFSGGIPSFEYLRGSLPFDALMGIAPWFKEDDLSEYMQQMSLKRTFGKHTVSLGSFLAFSQIDVFTSASFAYASYEPIPRMLEVTLNNPGESPRLLSDPNGIANHGALFYENADFEVNQFAFSLQDDYKIGPKWNAELGLRYENINHKGDLLVPAPFSGIGGVDGNLLTSYDNGVIGSSGIVESFDFRYEHLSYSTGLSYQFTAANALYMRFSKTHKAPELDFYLGNFSGLPIDDKGTTQKIYQLEAGYKRQTEKLSLLTTAFWSRLDDILFSEFVFDQQNGMVFYTPALFNKTTSYGLEIEWSLPFSSIFQLEGTHTLQKARATEFKIYDAQGTADTQDDELIDFSDHSLPHMPAFMSSVGLKFQPEKTEILFNWNYMSRRYGNVENAFILPAYSSFNGYFHYHINDAFRLGFQIKNIFNSAGLMNFFGPNEFGSNANQATAEYIQNNSAASFVVFPIMPRSLYFNVNYHF